MAINSEFPQYLPARVYYWQWRDNSDLVPALQDEGGSNE